MHTHRCTHAHTFYLSFTQAHARGNADRRSIAPSVGVFFVLQDAGCTNMNKRRDKKEWCMRTRPLTVHTLHKGVWSCRHCIHRAERPHITRQHLMNRIWCHHCIIVLGITLVSQQRRLHTCMLSRGARESNETMTILRYHTISARTSKKQQYRLSVSLLN